MKSGIMKYNFKREVRKKYLNFLGKFLEKIRAKNWGGFCENINLSTGGLRQSYNSVGKCRKDVMNEY